MHVHNLRNGRTYILSSGVFLSAFLLYVIEILINKIATREISGFLSHTRHVLMQTIPRNILGKPNDAEIH